MSLDDRIAGHYANGTLARTLSAALREAAPDRPLTAEDLAPVDEFHIGGRTATAHFVEQLGIAVDSRVLDVGSGIGGTSRYVATRYGASVTGVDLTPEYCEVASMLSELVGLSDRVRYRQGSALGLPFDDGEFSLATMLHVGMNVPDKPGLFREVQRVLEPGGVFGIYDILGVGADELDFPVPWAATPETSFLATVEEMRSALDAAGFTIEVESDRSAVAREFFQRLGGQASQGPPPLGLHLLMGDDFATKVANMARNVETGRCAPWELICRKR